MQQIIILYHNYKKTTIEYIVVLKIYYYALNEVLANTLEPKVPP